MGKGNSFAQGHSMVNGPSILRDLYTRKLLREQVSIYTLAEGEWIA